MKQARASKEEWQRLVDWFNKQDAECWPMPEWRRVVFGYDVLVENCADPLKETLEHKPGTSPQEIDELKRALATALRTSDVFRQEGLRQMEGWVSEQKTSRKLLAALETIEGVCEKPSQVWDIAAEALGIKP